MDEKKILNEEELEEINGGIYQGPVFRYTIVKNDCLSKIAEKYNTTVKILCELNNIENPNLIYAGKTLLVPYNS